MMRLDGVVRTSLVLLCLSACGSETPPEAPVDERAQTNGPKLQPTSSAGDAGSGTSSPNRSSVTTSRASTVAAGTTATPPQVSAGAAAPPPAASATPAAAMMAAAGASAQPTADAMCAALRSCCNTVVDARDKQLCQAIAEERSASLCKVASGEYCAATSTTTTATTATGAAECSALSTCCATLDEDDQEECQEVADAAVAADCRTSLTELCPDAVIDAPTTTSTSACAMLNTMCCATLEDDEDIEECRDAVAGAVEATCQETFDALCGAGGD